LWDFGESACLAEATCFGEAACLGEARCAGDLRGFGEPLKTSDNQPASLTSIGRSTDAAIMAMTIRRGQTQKPDPANCLPDESNFYFPPE
jgi:hypothetical protein